MTITRKQESLTKSAMQKTFSGLDHLLLQQNSFKNARIALVTNNAALTSGKEQCRVALLRKGFNIIKLFSPEHGLDAKGADGTYQSNSIDPFGNSGAKLPVAHKPNEVAPAPGPR